jgi:hypothetical protein
MQDRLELAQGRRVVEYRAPQRTGVEGAEAPLNGGARVAVVLADLARDGVGVDMRRSQVAKHAGDRALAAAEVAGQANDLHGLASPPATGSGMGWQCGQKCVLR